jgi:hypothetical protein
MNLKHKYLLHQKSILSSYSNEAEAVFALMDSAPPVWLKNKMNTYINFLVADGNWVLLKQLLFYAMDTEANSLVDWLGFVNAVNINSTPHTPVTEAHAGFAGFSPDGISKYINTKLKNSDTEQDNACGQAWLFTNTDKDNQALFGSQNSFSVACYTGVISLARINQAETSGANSGVSNFSQHTLTGGRRSAADKVDWIENGVEIATNNRVSVVPTNNEIFSGAKNNVGVADFFLNGNLCMNIVHQNNGFNYLAFYNRTLSFLQNLGIEA